MKLKTNFFNNHSSFFVRTAIFIMLLFLCLGMKAQTAGTAMQFTLTNFIQLTPNSFEYEMLMTNSGTTTLGFRAFSFGINLTPGLANGGTITHSYIANSRAPEFNTPTTNILTASVVYSASVNHLRVTTTNAPIGFEVPFATGVTYSLGRYLVTTTAASFPQNFNPFLPPALPANTSTALQLVTASGHTQCVAGCFVPYTITNTSTNYQIYGTGNSSIANALNVLNGIVEPSPTSSTPFILNPICNALHVVVDQNISCYGADDGSIQASTTAPGSWSYNIDGGAFTNTSGTFTSLTPGSHTVCAYDGTTTCCQTVTITEPAELAASFVVDTNPSCTGNDGTLSIVITGGTNFVQDYLVTWKDANNVVLNPTDIYALSMNNLITGNYSVTIEDNNTCVLTLNTSLGLTSVSATSTPILCFGGTSLIDATSTASSQPVTYKIGTTSLPANFLAGTYIVMATDANGCTKTTSITVSEPLNGLTASISSLSNVSCSGGSNGSATVSASGGTAPLTYAWTPSGGNAVTANGLIAGTYTVTISDANSCTATTTVTITEPTALSATINASTNVSCNGGSNGSATVSASGGTAPLSYAWAPSGGNAVTANGLIAGTYTVTISDANSCTKTITVTITEPTALSATISASTNVSCNGGSNGSATVNASGGTAPLTYAWTPSGGNLATANGLIAGTYTVTVTDANSCTAATTVTINQASALITSINSSVNFGCNGITNGTASVNANGGTPPYTYAWSPNVGATSYATGLAAGTYVITVSDINSCTKTTSVTFAQSPILSITCPSNQTANTSGACTAVVNYTSLATGTTSPTISYVFSGATTGSGIGNGSGSAFNKGFTTVTLSASNSCGTESCSFTITVIDNQAPTLSCPSSQALNVIANTCAANYTIADPISDNCTGATWGYILSGATTGSASLIPDGSGSSILSFNKGTTTVSLNGTDGTNSAISCPPFTITVLDNEAPLAICQAVTLTLNTQGQASLLPSQVNNNSTDNCGITNITVSKTNFDCSDVRNNTALSLDFSTDKVMSNSTASIPIGNNPRTFTAWINIPSPMNHLGICFSRQSRLSRKDVRYWNYGRY